MALVAAFYLVTVCVGMDLAVSPLGWAFFSCVFLACFSAATGAAALDACGAATGLTGVAGLAKASTVAVAAIKAVAIFFMMFPSFEDAPQGVEYF